MKKSIAIICAYIILNAILISCKTGSLISKEEASNKSKEEKSLILHTPTRVSTIDNFNFSENNLRGELKKKRKTQGFTIHVYSDLEYKFILKENEIRDLDLPKSHIKKITYSKRPPGKAIVIGAGATTATLLFAFIIRISTMAFN